MNIVWLMSFIYLKVTYLHFQIIKRILLEKWKKINSKHIYFYSLSTVILFNHVLCLFFLILWILHWVEKNYKGAKCFRTIMLKAVIHSFPFQSFSIKNLQIYWKAVVWNFSSLNFNDNLLQFWYTFILTGMKKYMFI